MARCCDLCYIDSPISWGILVALSLLYTGRGVCWHVCTLCNWFFCSSNIHLHKLGIACLILRWSMKEQLIWYLLSSSSWLRKLPTESSMSPTYVIRLQNQHFQNTALWSTVMFLLNQCFMYDFQDCVKLG